MSKNNWMLTIFLSSLIMLISIVFGHDRSPGTMLLGGILLLIVGIVGYFVPTIVACSRKKRNATAIGALNFFLGWTLVGWVVALVWAMTVDVGSGSGQ